MHVLMLTQFYAPDIGGEERHVQDLSAELVKRGHAVTVASIWHPDRMEYENDHGVKVFRLRSTTGRASQLYREMDRSHAPPFPDPELTVALWKLIEREHPDIIHAHNWMLHSFLPYRIFKHIPTVITLHDYSFVCAMKRLMLYDAPCTGPALVKCLKCSSHHYEAIKGVPIFLSNQAMRVIEKKTVDLFVAVSQEVAIRNRLVEQRLPYQVIPNFVPDDLDRHRNPADPRVAQLPDNGYLLYVGDLSRDKGIHILLKAYAGLEEAPPLILIGRKTLDTPSVFPQNVFHLGSWPHAAVMEAWHRCSIALTPSTWPEPFGIVAIEAMLSGRPVIASRIGGLTEIVLNGETGLLVPPGDAPALQKAIQRLLADPALRERMGRAGRQRVSIFKASNVVQQIEHIYNHLIRVKAASNSAGLIDDKKPEMIEK